MSFEINSLPAFGPIAHLVGRAKPAFTGTAILTRDEVIEIKKAYFQEHMRIVDIHRMFNVSRENVSNIVHGHSWKNIDERTL